MDFFLSYQTRWIYEKAMENFMVSEIVNRIYFFNPFSVEILQKVISRIVDSYYENVRSMQLFFIIPLMSILLI